MKPTGPSALPTPSTFSRRQWLTSASTVAAVAGAGFNAAKSLGAEPEKTVASGSLGTRVYDIRDFGAKGDGKTLDTAALQAALTPAPKTKAAPSSSPPAHFSSARLN